MCLHESVVFDVDRLAVMCRDCGSKLAGYCGY
jgi:ribosomal protein S27E